MIEDAPLLTLRRRFARPDKRQIAALSGAASGHVIDALGGRGALDAAIKPIGAGPAGFCGTALTCHAGPADNLAVFGAVAVAEPGDIILAAADGYRDTAVVGDLLLGMARNRGCAGFVTDGCVRDLPGIAAVGLPCFAAGVTPNSPARNGPGSVGLPIVIAGTRVAAGDLVIGDGDGVVVVPFAEIDAVIARLAEVRRAEAALEAEVAGGLAVPDFIAALFESGRVKEVE